MILQIFADYNTRLGAYKITYVLQRDYGIIISVGRVYRLMKTLQLPRMSTENLSVITAIKIMVNVPIIYIKSSTKFLQIPQKKKKLTGEPITLFKSYSYPYLNTLKDSTTQEGLTALLEC